MVRHGRVRIRAITLPTYCPGAWSSDHWSFWREGFPAVMATDTAALRYRHYHRPTDTPDKLKFEWLHTVVDDLATLLRELADDRPA